jgi:hypothetical protein
VFLPEGAEIVETDVLAPHELRFDGKRLWMGKEG